jgi:preprotein translocase subunit YajC
VHISTVKEKGVNILNRLRNYSAGVSILIAGLLFVAETAFAQGQAGGPPAQSFSEMLTRMLPMFAIVFMIFYFMIMKPQQDKLKAQKQLLESLKKGDWIVTSAGILGKVAGVEKDFVLIEISNNVRIKVEISHVTKRLEKEGGDKSDKSEKEAK